MLLPRVRLSLSLSLSLSFSIVFSRIYTAKVVNFSVSAGYDRLAGSSMPTRQREGANDASGKDAR